MRGGICSAFVVCGTIDKRMKAVISFKRTQKHVCILHAIFFFLCSRAALCFIYSFCMCRLFFCICFACCEKVFSLFIATRVQ